MKQNLFFHKNFLCPTVRNVHIYTDATVPCSNVSLLVSYPLSLNVGIKKLLAMIEASQLVHMCTYLHLVTFINPRRARAARVMVLGGS